MHNETIIFILNLFVYGFCFTAIASYILAAFKSNNLRSWNTSFYYFIVKTIRIIGILYFIYYLSYLISFYFSTDQVLFTIRATGPYWFSYWFMLLRPLLFYLLIQLFWFKSFQIKNIKSFLLILLILLLIIASGENLERFVILTTAIHRDYIPNTLITNYFTLQGFNLNLYLLFIVLFIIERLLIFTALTLLIRSISLRIKIKTS
ncbi:hypothetical protein [Lacinutrix sp. MedPE-SW]|uniref:hypothetical protein n=1 Tax=Lacinutrix sp. MedPE-SW TaxID=1860087 RepID=UPI000919E023|nr:hypothetical protein [Lacinutrix sp. MedPE-SW]OIQ23767.1 MAG: hypothetical protein BM549_00235 [Lacinutrix sp. MedPE-SW]